MGNLVFLRDIGALTESELSGVERYRITSVQSLYSRITQGKNKAGLCEALGCDEVRVEQLELILREYLQKHDPDFLIPKQRPNAGYGARNPFEM